MLILAASNILSHQNYSIEKCSALWRFRYYHMRAYFCMFTGKTDKAFRLLKEAVLLGDKLGNVLDREWAKHSLYVSHPDPTVAAWAIAGCRGADC